MSETGGSADESPGGGRDRAGRVGGFAGALGALLVIAGLVTMGSLPGKDVSAPGVYEFFLDETGEVARPTAMIAVGLLLALVMFATMRAMMSERRGSSAAGAAMLAMAQIGIGLQVVALTMIGVLTLSPADADPGTSRAILDLSELLSGISGAALALALIAMALGVRRTPGLLPARFAQAALLVAVGVALWTVRLFSDSSTFAADSFLGSTLGWILLIASVLAAGVWLLAIRPRRALLPAPGERPGKGIEQIRTPVPRPRVPRPSPAQRAAAQMAPTSPPPRLPTLPSGSPPRPRKPFVPPPYPETPMAETERAENGKPGTPRDEPATVPEPESGVASDAAPERGPEAALEPGPEAALEPEPEPVPELESDPAPELEPAEPEDEPSAEREPADADAGAEPEDDADADSDAATEPETAAGPAPEPPADEAQ